MKIQVINGTVGIGSKVIADDKPGVIIGFDETPAGIMVKVDFGTYTGYAFPENIKTLGIQSFLQETPPSSLRLNQGKTQVRELDPAFIMGMAEVLTKSRQKYDSFNWTKPTKLSTPYESLFRHLMAFQSGEDVDPDDNCHHLLKVAVNAMFMYYHNTNFKEESDDRFFKKEKK